MKFSAAALFVAVAASPTTQAFVPNSLFLGNTNGGVAAPSSSSSSFAAPPARRSTAFLRSTTEDVNDRLLIEEMLSKVSPTKTAKNNKKKKINVKQQPQQQQQKEQQEQEQYLNHSTRADATQHARHMLQQYQGQNGASIIYSKLQENGVTVVNGFSGGAVLPLLDQFHDGHPRHAEAGAPPPIRWITNSNESSAGHIAEGYAKAMPVSDDPHRRPVGVVVATSGPGVTNLITPLQDAICDGVPIVVLCGQAATVAPQDAFQSSPAVALTRPCTKWSYQISSAAELPMAMDYAFFVARNGRPGPVFVDLPKDLQNQVLTEELIEQFVEQNLSSSDSDSTDSSTDSDDKLLRFEENQRSNGETFQAFNLGYHGQGLPFEVAQDNSDSTTAKLMLKPVSYISSVNSNNKYHADHHPTNTVHATNTEAATGSNDKKVTIRDFDVNSPAAKDMAHLIQRAKKPVIIAGQGCNDAPQELQAFAEKLQIPVTTTLHALGCFDERNDLALNMLGMHGHPTPNFMVQEADLIICIGSRFDDRITGRMSDFVPEARQAAQEGRGGIIHVDIRLTENAKQIPPTFFVHSTGKNFLRTMNSVLEADDENDKAKPPITNAWLQHMRKLQKEFPVKVPKFPTETVPVVTNEENGGEEITTTVQRTRTSAQSVIAEMNRQMLDAGKMDDAIFTTGVGIHQMVAAQLITWTQPRQMLSSGSLGTMGVSLGYSIGAKLANGKKIVISVDGDGSFNMTFTELKTLAEQKIPVKILLLDNDGQMMVEYWQRLFHDNRLIAVRNSHNPDYSTLAKAFGIKSLYCDCEEELEEKMKEFLFQDPDEPVLFHCRIERTPCLPLVAPGQPLEDMILEDIEVEVDQSAAPS